jgi:hypothetical protein
VIFDTADPALASATLISKQENAMNDPEAYAVMGECPFAKPHAD